MSPEAPSSREFAAGRRALRATGAVDDVADLSLHGAVERKRAQSPFRTIPQPLHAVSGEWLDQTRRAPNNRIRDADARLVWEQVQGDGSVVLADVARNRGIR